MKKLSFFIGLSSFFISHHIHADSYEQCLLAKLKDSVSTMTVGEIKESCLTDTSAKQDTLATEIINNTNIITQDDQIISASKARLIRERETAWSPHVLTAHKQNYILPYSYSKSINPIYKTSEGLNLADKHDEAKFQLSIKIPLIQNDIFMEGDGLDFGFTLKSFWQVYSHDYSSPFRETNYNPEIFYTMPIKFRPDGADTAIRFGIEHESNGRTQVLSRSWNRAYTQFFYAKDNYLLSLKPWYRIPEQEKDSPLDSSGDDNPDIEKYLGNFELSGVAKYSQLEFSTLIRNNLRDDNKGAIELGMSFPLCLDGCNRIRGYIQYFNGYGESLIDYNHRIERIGLGFLITDIM